MANSFIKSGGWFLLPNQAAPTLNSQSLNPILMYYGMQEKTPEDLKKCSTIKNLLQVGVVFKHKGSNVLWEIIEIVKESDGSIRFARAKSRKSGYKKAIWPDEYTYDNMELVEAPEALKILFGEQVHVDSSTIDTSGDPLEAEQAFDIELTEDFIGQNDKD